MQLTRRGLTLLSITALFLLAASFAPVLLWLAGGWLGLTQSDQSAARGRAYAGAGGQERWFWRALLSQ